jgi:DNA-binding NarL/FixJ family response regulator
MRDNGSITNRGADERAELRYAVGRNPGSPDGVTPPPFPRRPESGLKSPQALQHMPREADGTYMAIRVVIADDHSLVRQGLRRYLEMAGDIQVVGEASNGREVLGMMENGSGEPDIVLLDIRMPEMDGLETARKIKQRHPRVGVIMLTAYDDRQFVVEAVRAGARGYVLKARDAEHLIQTVRLVAGGNMVIDPQLVVALADELSQSKERDRKAETLTAREVEVLQLLAFGHTNKDIADQLFISPDTVKTHLEHIFEKLGASDRTAAVAEALRRRLIE